MRSIVVAAMALALVACSDDVTNPATSFTAALSSTKVRPAPVTPAATGSATCTVAASQVSCTLSWTDLGAVATSAYIGSGNASATGTAGRVYLCGGGTAPAPACPGATASGFTSGAQPVETGITYDALVGQMRTYGAFVQVETATGARVRGQFFGVY